MAAVFLAALLATAAPAPASELDYRPGALAFAALVEGDVALAERQLRQSDPAARQDPAWLLNYGHLLARTGRVTEASAVFRQVADAPDSEVVLASGEVIGTREASRRASQRLRLQGFSSR